MTIAMSPGHCRTDMGGENAPRSSMEGAELIFNHIEGEYRSDIFYHSGEEHDFMNCGPQPN